MKKLVENPDAPNPKRKLMTAVFLDALFLIAGVGLYLATGSYIWLIAGAVLGSMFLIPAMLSLSTRNQTGGED